jgi:hypothetical protein
MGIWVSGYLGRNVNTSNEILIDYSFEDTGE